MAQPLTRLRVLLETVLAPGRRVVDLAEALNLTHQAVSAQLKRLEADGLVRTDAGVTATPAGVQALHDAILDLRSLLEHADRGLTLASATEAWATKPIRKGARVRLEMRGGALVATPGAGDCTGTARSAAARGRPVVLEDLQGIIDHRLGAVHVLEIPLEPSAAAAQATRRRLRALKPGIVGAVGPVAEHTLRRAGVSRALTLGVPEAAVEGALRGLVAAAVATPASVREVLRRVVQARQRWNAPVPVHVETL